MALTRQSIVRGHGKLVLGSGGTAVEIPCAGGIEADVPVEETELSADDVGKFDCRLADVTGKIVFTPLGLLTADLLGVLYPAGFSTPVRGTSLHGSADVPLTVHSKAGQKVIFHSAALTRMPPLTLSANKPLFGQAEFSAVRGNGLEWSNAAAFFTGPTAEAYVDPTFDSADVPTKPYTASWGTILTSIIAQDGWNVDFTVASQPDKIDGYGTNDNLLDDVAVVARCTPKNLSESLLAALLIQGTGVAIGMSRRRASNLVITSGTAAGDLTVTLYDACMLRGPLKWRGLDVRAGELAFGASRVESTGAYGAVFNVAIEAGPPEGE